MKHKPRSRPPPTTRNIPELGISGVWAYNPIKRVSRGWNRGRFKNSHMGAEGYGEGAEQRISHRDTKNTEFQNLRGIQRQDTERTAGLLIGPRRRFRARAGYRTKIGRRHRTGVDC
jgi:hypothetical protein